MELVHPSGTIVEKPKISASHAPDIHAFIRGIILECRVCHTPVFIPFIKSRDHGVASARARMSCLKDSKRVYICTGSPGIFVQLKYPRASARLRLIFAFLNGDREAGIYVSLNEA